MPDPAPIGPDLSGRHDAPYGVSSDEHDVLIRRLEATPEDAKRLVCVRIDGYDVVLPMAARRTDPKGGELRDARGPLYRRTTVYDAATRLVGAAGDANGDPISPAWTWEELKRRIPTLSHLTPAAVCRVCSVHVSVYKRGALRGERKLLPACHLEVSGYEAPVGTEGAAPLPWMIVTTRCGKEGGYNPARWGRLSEQEKAEQARRADLVEKSVSLVVELLAADHLRPRLACERADSPRYENELDDAAARFGVRDVRPSFRRPEGMFSRNTLPQGGECNRPSETDPARPHARPVRPIPLLTLPPTPIDPEGRGLPRADRTAWVRWNELVDRQFPYSSRAVVVDHDACIQCDRCVRSCGEVRGYHVIGHTGKGYATRIAFDLDNLMGPRAAAAGLPADDVRPSGCVQCGECMTACPTGALSLRRRVQPRAWGDESPQLSPQNPNTPIPRPEREGGDEFPDARELRELSVPYTDPQSAATGPRELRPFASVPLAYLKWNEGAVRKIMLGPGQGRVLTRNGEYGSTAFLLEGTGTFELFKAPPTGPGLIGRLLGRPDRRPAGEPFVRVPGTTVLIGEMAPLSYRPRSATIWAVGGAERDRRVRDHPEPARHDAPEASRAGGDSAAVRGPRGS